MGTGHYQSLYISSKRQRRREEPEVVRIRESWKSSWELNMSDKAGGWGGGERRRWCRTQEEGEKRETRGEQLTLFSDQRTEYRLERQKIERSTGNEKQREVRESGRGTQWSGIISNADACWLGRWWAATGSFWLVLNYCCHMYTNRFSSRHTWWLFILVFYYIIK